MLVKNNNKAIVIMLTWCQACSIYCPYIDSPSPPNHLWGTITIFFPDEETEAQRMAELGLKHRTPVSRDHAVTTRIYCFNISVLWLIKTITRYNKAECVPGASRWLHTTTSGHEIHRRYTSTQSGYLTPFSKTRNQGPLEKWPSYSWSGVHTR